MQSQHNVQRLYSKGSDQEENQCNGRHGRKSIGLEWSGDDEETCLQSATEAMRKHTSLQAPDPRRPYIPAVP